MERTCHGLSYFSALTSWVGGIFNFYVKTPEMNFLMIIYRLLSSGHTWVIGSQGATNGLIIITLILIIWGFPYMGATPNGWFTWKMHHKWMIWGYLYFWKPPYTLFCLIKYSWWCWWWWWCSYWCRCRCCTQTLASETCWCNLCQTWDVVLFQAIQAWGPHFGFLVVKYHAVQTLLHFLLHYQGLWRFFCNRQHAVSCFS